MIGTKERSLRRSAAGWAGFMIGVVLIAAAIALLVVPRYRTPSSAGQVPAPFAAATRPTAGGHLQEEAGGQQTAVSGTPTQLVAPSIGVDAPVVPVGVSPTGALGVPDNPRVLGWWQDGPRPGQTSGTAVIDGHVDSAKTGTGALFHLEGLQPGEIVKVVTDRGPVRYKVAARAVYSKNSLPADLFINTGRPRLAIITCGGPFDRNTGHYEDNVVVYALPG